MSGEPAPHQLIAPDVTLGRNVQIHAFVNLYRRLFTTEPNAKIFMKKIGKSMAQVARDPRGRYVGCYFGFGGWRNVFRTEKI